MADKRQMQISGGMTTSARQGNGIWFNHDQLAALADAKPQAPYVMDHGMDIANVAGYVKTVTAKRFDIEVPVVQQSKKDAGEPPASIKEMATRLYHTSTLNEDFAAYPQVKRHIDAMRESGQIPQESIALQAVSISYEPATDRLFLEGPYMLVHHSLVSKGAFGPEDGVGIFDIADEPMRFGAAVEMGAAGEAPVLCAMRAGPVLVTNLPDLVKAFAISHADNPAALRAAMRAGLNASEFTTPASPPGSDTYDDKPWSRPTLADFTDKAWADLSGPERSAIARSFAYYSKLDTYGDLHLPHHRPKSGVTSVRGVKSAKARANQVSGISAADLAAVMSHLDGHLAKAKELGYRVDFTAEELADTAAIAAVGGDSNTALPPSPTQGERGSHTGDPHMPEPPAQPAGAGTSPAPPTSAELEALVSAKVDARFKAEKADRDALALTAKRQSIVDAYGVGEATVSAMDAKGIEAFETHLRNEESQGLVRRAPKAGTSPNEAHFKALDAGRDAFVKRISIVREA